MSSKLSRKAKSVLPFIGALALTLTPFGFIAYAVVTCEDPAAPPLADSKYIAFFNTHRSSFQAAEKVLDHLSPPRAERRILPLPLWSSGDPVTGHLRNPAPRAASIRQYSTDIGWKPFVDPRNCEFPTPARQVVSGPLHDLIIVCVHLLPARYFKRAEASATGLEGTESRKDYDWSRSRASWNVESATGVEG
jgi:hypothetical protein